MDAQHYRGNIGNDVELERTKNDVPYVKLRLAVNDRYLDRQGQWQERETFWVSVEVWRDLAVRVADSLQNGHAVIVVGKWRSSSYEVEGKKRTRNFFVAESIGPDMEYNIVSNVERVKRRETPAAGEQKELDLPQSDSKGFVEPDVPNPFENDQEAQ